ncbi:MAG: prolipoprotein diacylglyceryl transferase [Acidimicrobiaceae bacterium]|jgi:prolipoprotein diacylglyceryl transferase|nr:prolipoprotein diacylglyceryl transferase [Ilumatobacteraceae bacterium]
MLALAATTLLSSIPSPSSGALSLGSLKLNAYGLMIAIGVIVAVRIAGRRAEKFGVATMEDFSSIATWAVPAGIIGGRVYHVITDVQLFRDNWVDAFKIWQGGLGIWGGVLAGVLVGFWRAKVRGLDAWWILTCAAPAIPVAQAIGRWGNWWNQELFGRPTDLPWALSVSNGTAIKAGYPIGTTFHPTFLYESLACLALAALLLVVEKRFSPARGRLIAWYAAGYTTFRFFIEGLRIDSAHSAGGLRLNQWVSLVVFAIAVGWLAVDARRSRDGAKPSTVTSHE